MLTHTEELYLSREMPTDGGSEDPADFVITGDYNGKPPALYPAVTYLAPEAMSVEGDTVTARIKKDLRSVLPVMFYLRKGGAGEFWNITPESLYYEYDSWTMWPSAYNFGITGDLGEWACTLSLGEWGKEAILASGPQEIGGMTIPAGSVAVDLENANASCDLVAPLFIATGAIDTLNIDFDYFTFEDPWDTGNTSRVEIGWTFGTYGQPDYDYWSGEFDLDTCEAGENSFFLGKASPPGSQFYIALRFIGSTDGRLVASMPSIRLTSM